MRSRRGASDGTRTGIDRLSTCGSRSTQNLPHPDLLLAVNRPPETRCRGGSMRALRRGCADVSPALEDSGSSWDTCCVCLESVILRQGTCVFPCGHRLHSSCAENWLRVASQPSCPTCRRPVFAQTRRQSEPAQQEGFQPPGLALEDPLHGLVDPTALDAQDSTPNCDVAAVMASCRCPRPLAEAAVRAATAPAAGALHIASRSSRPPLETAAELASASLAARGRALRSALLAGNTAASLSLLAGGADLDVRGSWGSMDWKKTALMLSVQRRQYHLARQICEAIEAGKAGPAAHVDAKDERGFTALDLAADRRFPELCALLVAFGAETAAGRVARAAALQSRPQP